MSTANPEQRLAIENLGGALLSAGAGSGKTFVLTEHLIYLAQRWMDEWSPDNSPEFSQFIRNKFSKVVLMTFTKKAAGEIAIRIEKNFKSAAQRNPERELFWRKAVEQLDSLTITTIHGYCYKLIKQGFFTEVNPNDDIIGEGEFSRQIEEIFNRWLDERLGQENGASSSFVNLALKQKSQVLSALKGIISDPTLRLMWKNLDTSSYSRAQTDEAVEALLRAQSFGALFDWDGDLSASDSFQNEKWFPYLERVSRFAQAKDLSLEAVAAFARELADNGFSIPRVPTKKAVPDEVKDLYKLCRDFKDFLKTNHEDLFAFEDEGERAVKNWYENFRQLFAQVEQAYGELPGMTFGDLEFIVNNELESPAVREMVKKEYNYLIVDEFQDTSYIQFSILQKIIDGDYSKLFCVGDIKQAIYGFRGGELGVFREMGNKTPLNLNLLNNYRSDQSIIKFNNALFETLFALGMKFQGKDPGAIKAQAQTIPLQERAQGKVFEIEADLSFLDGKMEKLSNEHVEYFEALALLEEIKRSLQEDGITAVLYRKLKPSKALMQLLTQAGIGFTSQVKIPLLEDPALGIFHLLAKRPFDQGKLQDAYLEYGLSSYFKLLGKEDCSALKESIRKFYVDAEYYGVYQAFLSFLASNSLSVSTYQNSLENIKLMERMEQGSLSSMANKLEEWSALSYSLDFQYGKNPEKVVIMSAHASKGLEFSKTLLGGIYTNDKAIPSGHMFGKTPYSFRWARSIEDKKNFKSPQYMLEAALHQRKEFSESKRLFYVACTRAENALGWVSLNFGPLKRTAAGSNSWIAGIQAFWESEAGAEFAGVVEKRSANIESAFDLGALERIANRPPMFHYDNLGVETRLENSPSFLMAELSVTRLAQVVQCPRKFYLSNILKLEGDFSFAEAEESERKEEGLQDLEELSSKSFSSAERGIEVHETLSQAIIAGVSTFDETELEGSPFKGQVSWAIKQLGRYGADTNFISERAVKFELFHYMISGIPDLVVADQAGDWLEIWDFKTGRINEQTPENYWFQLYAYALAGFSKRSEDSKLPIKLILCYVDEKKNLEKTVSLEEVKDYLWQHCQGLSMPDKTNQEHCASCQFNKICKGKSLSPCASSFSC